MTQFGSVIGLFRPFGDAYGILDASPVVYRSVCTLLLSLPPQMIRKSLTFSEVLLLWVKYSRPDSPVYSDKAQLKRIVLQSQAVLYLLRRPMLILYEMPHCFPRAGRGQYPPQFCLFLMYRRCAALGLYGWRPTLLRDSSQLRVDADRPSSRAISRRLFPCPRIKYSFSRSSMLRCL